MTHVAQEGLVFVVGEKSHRTREHLRVVISHVSDDLYQVNKYTMVGCIAIESVLVLSLYHFWHGG